MNKLYFEVKEPISFKYRKTLDQLNINILQMDGSYSCSNRAQNPTNLLVLSISDKIRTKQKQLLSFVISTKIFDWTEKPTDSYFWEKLNTPDYHLFEAGTVYTHV